MPDQNMDNIPTAKPVEPQATPPAGPPASARATTTLILGILSIVCAGFLAGIPAIIIGRMELRDIKSGIAPKSGEGIAKVGFILGIIGTALSCIITLVSIGMIVLAVMLGTSEAMKTALL